MSSPFPTLLICMCYIYCVKSLGPRLMANRKPFELRTAIIIYNIIQVVFSIYIVYKVFIMISNSIGLFETIMFNWRINRMTMFTE